MEEQTRLYIRLAMEDSGFHLHTSMDNNMYNLIIVTRFPSFDTSARMSPLFIALYERGHLQKILLVSKIVPNLWCSIATTFVSHRGHEMIDLVKAYHTGGYDPVVPPVAPPPDRIGATEALIRLSVLLRQSFVLKSRLCSPQVPRKREGETEALFVATREARGSRCRNREERRGSFGAEVGSFVELGAGVQNRSRRRVRRRKELKLGGWSRLLSVVNGSPKRWSLRTGDEPEGERAFVWDKCQLMPRREARHFFFVLQPPKLSSKWTTGGTPILTDGDPVGKISPPNTGLLSSLSISPSSRDKTPLDTTVDKRRGEPRGKRDLIIHSGFHKAWRIGTLWDTDTVKQRGMPTRSRRYVKSVQLVHGRTVRVQWTTNTGGRTFPERNWISCTESNSSGDSFGSRVMACVASTRRGRTKSFSVSAGRDPVFPSEVTTYFSLSYIFLIQEEGEMCSVGTTTEEGEEETGKVKVLATVDLACGGLLSTASELCTACLIIPLVLRESASCHSSPELRGSGTTTGGTTGSSLDVVGVPTSITWGATPKAVNCAVIVAMALAISAICACNCNTVASVSTERGGPPCAEVEVGRNVLPGLRRSQERLQHRGCEQLRGDVAPAVKGPLAAGQAPAEPQKQPSPELLPQMQPNETEQKGQELQQKSSGSAGQSQSEKVWQKQKPGEKKEREARPEHPSSSKRKEEGRPEHESPLPERRLGELLADGAEGPEPV
ncbi:hypothetical protein M5K25_006359 [Dendrobium thyrsiflorum]|uniref:Uncharacterized protein n=1 Tax=Dendrobium thyrsiflorum TaxID=117978 RepID=A0ABD0VBE6_DENTH